MTVYARHNRSYCLSNEGGIGPNVANGVNNVRVIFKDCNLIARFKHLTTPASRGCPSAHMIGRKGCKAKYRKLKPDHGSALWLERPVIVGHRANPRFFTVLQVSAKIGISQQTCIFLDKG
jgi:hypothetical protein